MICTFRAISFCYLMYFATLYNEIMYFLFLWRYGPDFILKVPANFSPSPGTGKKFATRPEGSGKTENMNFNNLPKIAMEPKENSRLSPLLFV